MNPMSAIVEEVDELAVMVRQVDLLDQARALKDATWATSEFRDLLGGAVGRDVCFELPGGESLSGRLHLVGTDFSYLDSTAGSGVCETRGDEARALSNHLVPSWSISGFAMKHGAFALGGAVSDVDLHQGLRRLLAAGLSVTAETFGLTASRREVVKSGRDWVCIGEGRALRKKVGTLENCQVAPLCSIVLFTLNAGVAPSEVVAQLAGFHAPLPPSTNL